MLGPPSVVVARALIVFSPALSVRTMVSSFQSVHEPVLLKFR